LRTVEGQPSYRLANAQVELFLTRLGGHLAPITFDRGDRKLRPMHVAPWAKEKLASDTPAILRALRGDFFCMPFGGNEKPYRGTTFPAHGDTANLNWQTPKIERTKPSTTLTTTLKLKSTPGQVTKQLTLIDGQNMVYQQHTLAGMTGPMSPGHHATLRFPDSTNSGLISNSGFSFGQVYPHFFEHPEQGGYQSLKLGTTFDSLDAVSRIDGSQADLSRYPARRGYEDIVLLASLPAKGYDHLGWSAVAFPKERYVWFSVKDIRTLPSTVMWHSNGGRHYAPWSSRNINVLGIEEVMSYFHEGIAASAKANDLSRQGIQTHVKLKAKQPHVIRYAFGITAIPRGFDHVERLELSDDGQSVTLISRSGKQTTTGCEIERVLGSSTA